MKIERKIDRKICKVNTHTHLFVQYKLIHCKYLR